MQISKKIGLIISPKLLAPAERESICNPCCIKVPDWKIKKLGKYYLYFADHRGKFIKMAYSNNISKDWKIYKKKILKVNQFKDAKHHIASPEIYLDKKRKIFYMLTHSYSKKIKKGQWTYLSSSVNGITFNKVYNVPLAPFYLRIFKHKNYFFETI